jgi:hypothetical protein
MTRSRELAAADHDARRREDRERLEHAARALLTSEGWQRWVRVRATNGLARYSVSNQFLIALQRPDATFVAGFRAFIDLNRCVRKGEKAIRILAPIRTTRSEEQGAGDAQDVRVTFRAVPVFDVAQTDPIPDRDPVPLCPPSQPVTGDSHAHLRVALEQLATDLGYQTQRIPLEGSADGWCDEERREIVVNGRLPANGQVRVLVHELAHALGVGYGEYGRRRAEVLVDTVTYVVCGSVGLDVSGDSVPYVAGWGEDGALDAIREYAGTIDAIARRIESALANAALSDSEVWTGDGEPLRSGVPNRVPSSANMRSFEGT